MINAYFHLYSFLHSHHMRKYWFNVKNHLGNFHLIFHNIQQYQFQFTTCTLEILYNEFPCNKASLIRARNGFPQRADDGPSYPTTTE